jgi:hypothetical protein
MKIPARYPLRERSGRRVLDPVGHKQKNLSYPIRGRNLQWLFLFDRFLFNHYFQMRRHFLVQLDGLKDRSSAAGVPG